MKDFCSTNRLNKLNYKRIHALLRLLLKTAGLMMGVVKLKTNEVILANSLLLEYANFQLCPSWRQLNKQPPAAHLNLPDKSLISC